MLHPRSLALLPLLASLAACSQSPSTPAPSANITPAQNPHQILIKTLIAETDQAGLKELFPAKTTGTDFDSAPAGQPGGVRVGLVEGQISTTLRKLAANSHITIVGRPYMLTTPDLRAQLQVGQEIPTIASFKPRHPADPATAYDPDITYVFSGINLFCTPHIAHDSLITLDVDYSCTQLLGMDSQPAPGVPAAQQLKTTIPIFQTSSFQTRVAVRNDDTIVLMGRPQGQPGADGKVQILFLTPHLASRPDGTAAPIPPDLLNTINSN